jgi:Spy/CpxP family protein refolding chaperone
MTLGATALLAQQASVPAPDTTNQSVTSAKLTAEQKKQLGELRATARDQAAIIRNDQTLTADQKQAKLKELRTSTHEQMKSVLTPEQQKTFADRREVGKNRMAAKLGLTEDQQGKLKALFQSTHQQREAVLKNASLANDQKQAQLAQIRQTTQTQLATILTPDQLEKFHQMHRRHGHAKLG